MSQILNVIAFQFFPYVAFVVLLLGSWLRYDRAMYTWRTGSSQMLSSRGMRIGSNLFHIGVIAILLGHVVGLLTPHVLYEKVILSGQKQFLAMVVGGVFGAMILCSNAPSSVISSRPEVSLSSRPTLEIAGLRARQRSGRRS